MNWPLLANSLLVAGGVTLAAVTLGVIGALWLHGVAPGGRRAFLAVAVAGLALPPFLVTNTWLDLLGAAGSWRGWVPFNIYSLGGTIWVLTLLLWPITLLLAVSSLAKIEPSQLESEPELRKWSMIRWLLLPALRSSLPQAAILTFVLALNNFAVPAILQVKVFPAELWVSFNTTFDYGSALRLSLPLLLFPALLIFILSRSPIGWPRVQGPASAALFRQRLGTTWTVAAAAVCVSALILSVGVPVTQLITSSRTWSALPDALAAGREALANSFLFAALGASFCLAAGLLLWRRKAVALLWLPFLLPGVLVGIALIFALNRSVLAGFYQSAGIVVLGLVVRYGALSWTGARRVIPSVDNRLLDFARLNGANRGQLWKWVYWPQIAPEMAALWFVTYLLCLWDVETLVLIIPPGGETLALRIFNLLHYGHNAQVNALCLLLLGLAVLPLMAGVLWRHRPRTFFFKAPVALLGLAGLALGTSGCTPQHSNEARVGSKFFSRVQIIGSRGTALGQFNKPRSVAVDADDNLYVVDMTARVQKFSSDGVFLTSWQMFQTEKGRPKGMCRDAAGNIVVVEPHYAHVNHYTPQGELVAKWGHAGTNTGQLCLPRAVAAGVRGELVICEYTLVDRVQVFSAEGKWKMAFGRSGRGPGEFNRPEGLAIDHHNRIYVADSCNHRVQVFSADGRFLREYGRAGTGLGEMSYPYDVQVDAAGLQFVCEFGNSRIQIFDAESRPLEVLGQAGPAPGQFSNPWSIALDSAGNLYVADSQNHRVQKFIRKPSTIGNPVSGVTAWDLGLAASDHARGESGVRRP